MSKKLIGMLAGVALFGTGAAFANEGQATQEEQAQSEQSRPADSLDNQGSLEADKGNDASGIGGSGNEGSGASGQSSSAEGGASQGKGQQDPGSSVSGTASGTTSGELGTGGAGQEAQAQQPAPQGAKAEGEQELTGKVIKAEGNKLFIEQQGAIVELRTDKKTQFEGDVKRVKDFKEGDEIRASFTVKNKTQNQALSISKSSQGTGGAGFEDLGTSGSGELDNTGSGLEGGQGGSGVEGTGLEGSAPESMGTEPTHDLGTQTGSEGASEQPVDQSQSGSESGSQIQ